jgi:hypothetical protein
VVLDQREEEDSEEPSPRIKEDWVSKRDNPWDTTDKVWLKAQLETPRKEKIAGRCVLEQHIKDWQETCGGAEFMRKGMRPYWRDADSPSRLEKLAPVYDRPLNAKAEEAFWLMVAEEVKEGIVKKIRRDQVRFLNPTFPVPKSNGKWGKVVDCRRLNMEQREVHFRMDGADVVEETAREGDWATSHDLMNAFNHMLVSEEFVPYLAFSHRGEYFAYVAMPCVARHSPRHWPTPWRISARTGKCERLRTWTMSCTYTRTGST